MRAKARFISSLFAIFFLLFFLFSIKSGQAAEYDLVWEKTGSESDDRGALFDAALYAGSEYTVGTQIKSFGFWPLFFDENAWRIEKRDRKTGSILWSYTETLMGSAQAVGVDNSGFYVAGNKKERDFTGLWETNTWWLKKFDHNGNQLWEQPSVESTIILYLDPDGTSAPHSMVVDDSGVYLAGHQTNGVIITAYTYWIVEKRNPIDGSLIWRKEEPPPPGVPTLFPNKHLVARDLAIFNGTIFVGGYNYDQNEPGIYSRLEARNTLDGSMAMPVKQADLPVSNASINSVSVFNNALYVGGNAELSSPNRWIVQKRNPVSLDVITEINEDYSSHNERLNSISSDLDGIYLAGMMKNAESSAWRIERRDPDELNLIWENTDGDLSAGSEEAKRILVDHSEIYAVGYQNNSMYRAELRGDVTNCQINFEPVVPPPVNFFENSTDNSYSLREVVGSSHIFCDCAGITINQVSGPAGIVSISPNSFSAGPEPTDIDQPLTITTGTIDSCSEDFVFQANCNPANPNYSSVNFDLRVIKNCGITCSPATQTISAGTEAHLQAVTSFPSPPISWTITDGAENVESSTSPSPDELNVKSKDGIVGDHIQVQASNCCGTATCNINVRQLRWIEVTP